MIITNNYSKKQKGKKVMHCVDSRYATHAVHFGWSKYRSNGKHTPTNIIAHFSLYLNYFLQNFLLMILPLAKQLLFMAIAIFHQIISQEMITVCICLSVRKFNLNFSCKPSPLWLPISSCLKWIKWIFVYKYLQEPDGRKLADMCFPNEAQVSCLSHKNKCNKILLQRICLCTVLQSATEPYDHCFWFI